MIVATSVVDQARDFSPAFDPQNHPDMVVLRYLSSLQRTLVSKALQLDPHFLATPLEVAFPMVDPDTEESTFAEGVEIPEFQRWHGGTVVFANANCPPIELVKLAWESRTRPRFTYSAYLSGRRVYFTGTAATWEAVASVTLSYTPTPPVVDAVEEVEFILPDSAEKVLVDAAALFMAGRVPGGVAIPVTPGEAEAVWLEEVRRNRTPARIPKFRSR